MLAKETQTHDKDAKSKEFFVMDYLFFLCLHLSEKVCLKDTNKSTAMP